MMNSRNAHTAKSKAENQYYQSQLKKQDYDVTYDESHDFKESNDPEIPDIKDFENKPIKKEPFIHKFLRNIRNNLFQWIIGIVVSAISIFFVSYTWILAETKVNVDNNQLSISEIKDQTKELNDKVTDQYVQIQDELKTITKTIQDSNQAIIDKIHQNELEVVRLKTIEEITSESKNRKIE